MIFNHEFCSICEIVEDGIFCRTSKTIFYSNRFLYILQKKTGNKLCLEPHDTYVLFGMFFSLVNNTIFFYSGHSPKPLMWLYNTCYLHIYPYQ